MLFGKKKEKEQRSVLEEEQMQSPFRTIIKNLLENKLAMGGLIVFVSIFAMCFILPIWFHQDLNYQDPTQKNIAPGFSFLSVPSDLKDNAEVIEFGPTYGVGVDKDGYVYEWGQLTKNLKKIPADMGKVVDIAVGQDHVLAINDKGNLYTWGFNRMGLNVIPPELKGKKIADIEAGYQVSVVVTEDGKVVSWGNTSAVDISTANVKDEKVKEVKANIQTAIALTKDGKVISLAKKETALDNVPEEIQGKVEKIALTDKAAAAVLKDGTVKVWGNNHDHIFSVPEEVQGKAVDISGGRNHLVVVTEDGNAVAWGGNENNQAKVPAKATNIAKLASGYYQNCIIKEDGSVVTWGLKGYLLGTDNLGRNVFYRILKGGQMTMTVGFIAVIIQFAIGILVGGISGYYGGTVDILLMRLAEVVGSLPFIPLALILSALIGNKVSDVGRIIMIMLILGFLGWTGIAGLVRAQVLAERNKEFVVAAKALGVKEKNIIFRHIVPQILRGQRAYKKVQRNHQRQHHCAQHACISAVFKCAGVQRVPHRVFIFLGSFVVLHRSLLLSHDQRRFSNPWQVKNTNSSATETKYIREEISNRPLTKLSNRPNSARLLRSFGNRPSSHAGLRK